jgi:hypothetical protein
MINCRELTDASINKGLLENKILFVSIGILLLLQSAVLFLPIMQQWVGTTMLSGSQQLIILANIALLFIIVEIEKRITRFVTKANRQVSPTIS